MRRCSHLIISSIALVRCASSALTYHVHVEGSRLLLAMLSSQLYVKEPLSIEHSVALLHLMHGKWYSLYSLYSRLPPYKYLLPLQPYKYWPPGSTPSTLDGDPGPPDRRRPKTHGPKNCNRKNALEGHLHYHFGLQATPPPPWGSHRANL